ncbi:MAG: hypothetical protein ACR2QH_00930 [Geminicoccaceae bacterium]
MFAARFLSRRFTQRSEKWSPFDFIEKIIMIGDVRPSRELARELDQRPSSISTEIFNAQLKTRSIDMWRKTPEFWHVFTALFQLSVVVWRPIAVTDPMTSSHSVDKLHDFRSC